MKLLIAVALSGMAGFFLALQLDNVKQAGAGALSQAGQNGDTNGDGGIDVSDAVYLLQFLFAGGPNIAEIECPDAAPPVSLTATGQTECFGTSNVIECDNPRARGQDAFNRSGCPLDGRFVDNGDGTVSDNCTGLMWTTSNVDVNSDGEITSEDAKPWLEACQIANDMNYLGHDGWRVPNAMELLSIINIPDAPGWRFGAPHAFQVFPPLAFLRTWSSTHTSGAASMGLALESSSENCSCCMLSHTNHSVPNLFAAVRNR